MEPKILMIDIETAPNVAFVWGLFNQNIGINQMVEAGRTLCFAAKWYGKKGLAFSSEWGDGREDMVQTAWDLFDEADIICHYNGTKFDVPTLNKEFVLEGLMPPSPFRQIDLLPVVRRQFRFTSNKLDYVSQQLGIGKKTSHQGFGLWVEVLNGVPKALKHMEKYNKQDVVLLEELYETLLPWLQRTPNLGVYTGGDAHSCIRCNADNSHLIKRGYVYLQAGKYQRYCCASCGGWSRAATNMLSVDDRKALLRPV